MNPLISLLFDYTFQMNIKVQVTYSKAYLLSETWTMKLSASDEKQAQVFLFFLSTYTNKSLNALGVPVILGFLNDE